MDFDCHPCRSLGCRLQWVLLGTSLNANVLEEQPTYLRRDDEVNDGFNNKSLHKAFEPNDAQMKAHITKLSKKYLGKGYFWWPFSFDYATRRDVYDAKD